MSDYPIPTIQTGDDLRDWYKARKLSQGKLAALLGISDKVVGAWVLGYREIPESLASCLAPYDSTGKCHSGKAATKDRTVWRTIALYDPTR